MWLENPTAKIIIHYMIYLNLGLPTLNSMVVVILTYKIKVGMNKN